MNIHFPVINPSFFVKVTKKEYDECRINNIESKKAILRCDRPYENVKYTLYISKFSPVPDAIEFIPGNSYYFICMYIFGLLISFLISQLILCFFF